jgi:L-ascorbate metabolism protein UlaG (beta-lactamase superfamily)
MPIVPHRTLLQRLSPSLDGVTFHDEERPSDDQPLALQWLGTAGFRLQLHGKHLWFDPHLSRQSLLEVALGKIAPVRERILAHVDAAHGVVVGHSHFDHAMDAPLLATHFGAHVYGAEDTLNYCRGLDVPNGQLHLLAGDDETHALGPFAIGARRSVHSPFALGRVPFPGHIRRPFQLPAPASAWRVGQVLIPHVTAHLGPGHSAHGQRLTIAHVGSAALVDAELRGLQADVVLACTIGRHATPNFTHRLLDALQPRLVVPCHWDQFWRPIDAPVRQIPSNDLAGFLQEVAAHPTAPRVRVLPMLGWTTLTDFLRD